MKKAIVRFSLIGAALLALAFIPVSSAQDSTPAPADTVLTAPEPALDAAAPATTAADPVAAVIGDLAAKYPVVTSILLVIGLLRTVVKPIVAFLQARVAATETKEDDERLARAQRTWWARAILFVLDWGASIKPVR